MVSRFSRTGLFSVETFFPDEQQQPNFQQRATPSIPTFQNILKHVQVHNRQLDEKVHN